MGETILRFMLWSIFVGSTLYAILGLCALAIEWWTNRD